MIKRANILFEMRWSVTCKKQQEKFRVAGWKESQLYSLPFGLAVGSMYILVQKSFCTILENNFDEQD